MIKINNHLTTSQILFLEFLRTDTVTLFVDLSMQSLRSFSRESFLSTHLILILLNIENIKNEGNILDRSFEESKGIVWITTILVMVIS